MGSKKSVLVVAVCDEITSPGVFFKYQDLASSGNDEIDISFKNYQFFRKLNYLTMFFDAYFYPQKTIMYRCNLQLTPFLIFIFVLLKLRRKRIICEVPTPFYSHLKTTNNLINQVFYFFTAPIVFWLSDKVITYANEGGFLALFAGKMELIGNGISVTGVPLKGTDNKINGSLDICGAATIASWHGWDLVIRAIAKITAAKKFDVVFHVVGDGPEKSNLMELADELGVSKNIIFYGMLNRKNVFEIYSLCQLAVGTFNWSEISVFEASPLKYREYSCAGLPFLYSTFDPDYHESDVATMISGDDMVDCLVQHILKIIEKNSLPCPEECRNYAYAHLDFSKKIDVIFN